MKVPRLIVFLIALTSAVPLAALSFEHGDVIVVGFREGLNSNGWPTVIESNIRIHGRNGAFKRELFKTTRYLTDAFYRDGLVYVGARGPEAIERIDTAGNRLAPFTTRVNTINFLSPGPGGGLLANNSGGEMYQFDSGGMLVRFRDMMQEPRAFGGIDLSADQCTIYYAAHQSLARWDVCATGQAQLWGPDLAADVFALRILPDGTLLISLGDRVIHVDRNGNLIRSYSVWGYALALDIDGKTFWTGWRNQLLRVDIDSGAILSTTQTDPVIWGITVVGEPRAGPADAANIPALSPHVLLVLALSLGSVALIRLRMG